MSPKSRGRPPGRGRPRRPNDGRPVRTLSPADRLLHDAQALARARDVLDREIWASEWLGQAWAHAPLAERTPELDLCRDVASRVVRRPSPAGIAALAALVRVAPEDARAVLHEAIASVEAEPPPELALDEAHRAVSAWRAVDVWQSERVLFVDVEGPRPHTVVASILDTGGSFVDRLGLLEFGAGQHWDAEREPDEVPMPLVAVAVDEALTELATALRDTDMVWPRQDDPSYVELRALVRARCGGHEPRWSEWEPMADAARDELVDDFVATQAVTDSDVTRSLADLFLDYGDGYIRAGALAWSPIEVQVFLTDWLPRKATLDAEQRQHLPEVLRAWLGFALARRGVEPRWIGPVVAQIDVALPEFEDAFDDESAWGPAKAVVAELAARGVDLGDRKAVDEAISELNAESLARRLLDG
jgi:hypothetical protein